MKLNANSSFSLLPLMLFAGVIFISSCSDGVKTLDEVVEDATAEIREGDKLSFVRLANDAVVSNATIHKVEDGLLLITTADAESNPYWINLASAVSYQQESLNNPDGKESVAEESGPAMESVESIEEVKERLSSLNIPPPRNWEKLGILEKEDWIGQLTREAPDFLIAGRVVVSDVNDYFGILRISGDYSMPETVGEPLPLKNLPMDAQFQFNSPSGEIHVFQSSSRDRIKSLQVGDTYVFMMVLRPDYSYHRTEGKVTVELDVVAFH